MEAIFKKANELDLLIKGSELYRRFSELSKQLESDQASRAYRRVPLIQ